MQTILDLKAVVEAVGDAVVACDEAGAITLWNPAAERLFGFSETEALGASLDIIIPERMRKRHWDGYHETMKTGITKYGHDVLRVPALNKAGGTLSVSFTVAMLVTDDRKVATIVAVMRDETAQFQEARALRKRMTDLEAQLRNYQNAVPSSGASATPKTTASDDGGCPFSAASNKI
jgi:PAS domain S-box-containing protein